MNQENIRRILLLPFIILIIVIFSSILFHQERSSKLDNTYWIRLNMNETLEGEFNRSEHSVRRIEVRDFSIISTIHSVSDKSRKNGFNEGDLDFYGNFQGGSIVGMTHYRGNWNNCSIDLYSPTEMRLTDDKTVIYGSDLLPVFEPNSCLPWPQTEWQNQSFKLKRINSF